MKRVKFLPKDPDILLIVMLGMWFVLNLLTGMALELSDAEAVNWAAARNAAWGYFENPPLSNMMAWIGINIIGDSEIGVRLMFILLQPFAMYLLWQVVRPREYTWRTALVYFLSLFAIPLLHVDGMLAIPASALLITLPLLLWTYKRFRQDDSLVNSLLFGVGAALAVYAHYSALILVLVVSLSDIHQLRNWKLWLSLLTSFALLLPNLVWQRNHEWVTIMYPIQQMSGGVNVGGVFRYIGNILLVLNPLIVLPALLMLRRKTERTASGMNRIMKTAWWAYFLFWALASLKMQVSVHNFVPLAIVLVFVLTRSSVKYPKLRRFLMWIGLAMLLLFVVMKVLVMTIDTRGIRSQVLNNRMSYMELADKIGTRQIMFDNQPHMAAKLEFYSNNTAIAMPSKYCGSNQTQLKSGYADSLKGRDLVVQLNPCFVGRTKDSVLKADYRKLRVLNSEKEFYVDTIQNYIPTSQVEIRFTKLPRYSLVKGAVTLDAEIENPYPYDIPLGRIRLVASYSKDGLARFDQIISIPRTKKIDAKSKISTQLNFNLPVIKTGKYDFTLSLQYPQAPAMPNSPARTILITNPRL